MKKLTLLVFALIFGQGLFGQTGNENNNDEEFIPDAVPFVIDSLYREDQFYLGFNYNFIINKAASISQSGFSGGFQLGFIRDFPLNERRNLALGVGLGWAFNTYSQNLFIGEENDGTSIFRSLDDEIPYDRNRFSTQVIEAPVQFRWRTSTAKEYRFWRIYTGLRLGYIYSFRSNFEQPGNRVRQSQVSELNRFRVGATFTFGYNTFNFQIFYSLNPLFEGAEVNGAAVGIHPLRVGLMFYIL